MEKKVMKFICEFIIDSYDQKDKPSMKLMNKIFTMLVAKDDKKESLQQLKEFKDNLSKLCKIALEDISICRYVEGLEEKKGNEEEEEKEDH